MGRVTGKWLSIGMLEELASRYGTRDISVQPTNSSDD